MKKILFLLLICFQAIGQTPLRSIQPCKFGGVVTDSCFIMTDANGVQTYISYTDLITIVSGGSVVCNALNGFTNRVPISTDKVYFQNGSSCYKGTISDLLGINKYNCDSVLACMNSGTLCTALAAFADASIISTDKLFFQNAAGECKKGLVSSISGFGYNCDSVLACLNDGILCEALDALNGGTPIESDSILYFHNGECLKGSIGDISGSYNCDSVKACISGTWFCDSIEACLNDGILCDALKDFDFMSVEQNGEIIWITNEGECKRGNVADIAAAYQLCDTLNALVDTEFDTAAGKVIWLDGGECKQGSLTTLFRNFNACDSLTNTGCKLTYTCAATGQVSTSDYHIEPGAGVNEFNLILSDHNAISCLRSTFSIGSIVSNITSSLSCAENKLVVTKDGANIDVDLPEYSLAKVGDFLWLLQNGVPCGSGLNICTWCDVPLMAPSSSSLLAGLPENGNSLKRYKTHKDADKDKNLPSGGYYLVGKYRSIQVKP